MTTLPLESAVFDSSVSSGLASSWEKTSLSSSFLYRLETPVILFVLAAVNVVVPDGIVVVAVVVVLVVALVVAVVVALVVVVFVVVVVVLFVVNSELVSPTLSEFELNLAMM